MINKCRVILKRVPGYFNEEDLREELSARCGQIQSLFQFKARIPNKLGSFDVCSQFKVFSVVFDRKDVAQTLIVEGKLILSKGAVVIVEPYLKGQKNFHGNNYQQQHVVKESFLTSMDKQHQLINTDDTLKTRGLHQAGRREATLTRDCDHAIRPTSSQYQARFEDHHNRIWQPKLSYRLNRHSRSGVPRARPGIEI